MSIFDKLSSMLNSDDDYEDESYYLDDDYEDDGDFADYAEADPVKNSFFSRNRSGDTAEKGLKTGLFSRRSDVLSVAPPQMSVSMKKPKNVNAFQDICDDLLDGKAVVINLEGVSTDVAQRIIDFTFGAVYSINGDLKEISKFIFIASPRTIELSGEFGNGIGFEEMPAQNVESFGRDRSSLRKTGSFGF